MMVRCRSVHGSGLGCQRPAEDAGLCGVGPHVAMLKRLRFAWNTTTGALWLIRDQALPWEGPRVRWGGGALAHLASGHRCSLCAEPITWLEHLQGQACVVCRAINAEVAAVRAERRGDPVAAQLSAAADAAWDLAEPVLEARRIHP